MTSGVPWEVEGVRPQARESALEAARRSGMSVGEWLDSLIIDRAPDAEPDHGANARRGKFAQAADLAEVRGRLDEVGRQLDQLSRFNTSAPPQRPDLPEPGDHLADAITRLDRRLERLMTNQRAAEHEVNRAAARIERTRTLPADAGATASPLEQALMEIAERQRALEDDGEGAVIGSSRPDLLPRAPTQDLSNLEQQLRQVTSRIESLQPCGVDKALETLRDDLAEIGLMLKEAMPRQAIEALEAEVRGLSERLQQSQQHQSQQTGAADAAIAGIERGLAEIREALRALTPAEHLVGIDDTVRDLSHRIDLIASNTQDPGALDQLENAIAGLRGIATHVASDGTLSRLSDDVRTLAAKVDQIASSADSGADLLSTLEHRIASIAQALEARGSAGPAAGGDFDAVVRMLSEKLERLEFARSDQLMVGQFEERIASLIDKLDTSSSRLDQLENIERGLSELMANLERRQQSDAAAAAAPSPEVNLLRRDMQHTRDSLETMKGTLGQLVDRLATIEHDVRSGAPLRDAPARAFEGAREAPAVKAAGVAAAEAAGATKTESAAAPPAPERRPIDPNLPPDHPLEPGAIRARGGSPGERIAASEAALGSVKPPVIPDPAGGKANFIAAARRAAQAASSEAGPRGDKRATPAAAADAAAAPVSNGKALLGRWGGRMRQFLVAASVVAIVLSSLHLVVSLFTGDDQGTVPPPAEPAQLAPQNDGAASVPNPPANSGAASTPALAPALPSGRQSLFAPPGESGQSAGGPPIDPQAPLTLPVEGTPPAMPEQDVTGALGRPMTLAPPLPAGKPAPVPPSPAPRPGGIEKLPAAIGGALRAAAAKGDPNAEFEIGQRLADGRGVPQNLVDAADWFERAAKQGLAPAQFRLGGFYEKGFGVKKDLEAARRLYTAAAEAGNAKAMHNLAVLYAEGIDGKPDYATAARWFRKGADYGVTDSQYNLGILYARGIGLEANLAQAYKWFFLAAREGDREAGLKRDDVGSRLDAQALAAAKLEAQGFTPLEQPETAVQASTPPGGWDTGAPPPANPKPRASSTKAELTSMPVR
jgi:localization factor PodJL